MALTEIKTSGIADDAVTTDKLANAINTERTANTAKATNATHSGDVTGSGSLTIADNAVTLAKMAGGTDGQIITYDASGDPVAVGPGTDGQVLTSTGAGSPPAFEDVPAGGATINNATANELVTVASTTTQLDAEANLTFDGNDLTLGNGDIIFGTAGKGICLGVTSNTDSNTLDDYEEGTYTAQIEHGFKGATSYTAQNGRYTKVGNLVHYDFAIQFNSATSNGTQIKVNLPFSSVSGTGTSSGNGVLTWYNQNSVSHVTTPSIYIAGGALGSLYVYQYGVTAPDDQSQNSTYLIGGGTFRAV